MPRVAPRRGARSEYRRPGIDLRCPSCGGCYAPEELRLRRGSTRRLAVCGWCYRLHGPDGLLETRRLA